MPHPSATLHLSGEALVVVRIYVARNLSSLEEVWLTFWVESCKYFVLLTAGAYERWKVWKKIFFHLMPAFWYHRDAVGPDVNTYAYAHPLYAGVSATWQMTVSWREVKCSHTFFPQVLVANSAAYSIHAFFYCTLAFVKVRIWCQQYAQKYAGSQRINCSYRNSTKIRFPDGSVRFGSLIVFTTLKKMLDSVKYGCFGIRNEKIIDLRTNSKHVTCTVEHENIYQVFLRSVSLSPHWALKDPGMCKWFFEYYWCTS